MATFADWIVSHPELDGDPFFRDLRGALLPLNEQNHLPVVHATLGQMWAAEAETKATRFVISADIIAVASALMKTSKDVEVVFELSQNWIVQNGWFEFAPWQKEFRVDKDARIGLHFLDGNLVDFFTLTSKVGSVYWGRMTFGDTIAGSVFEVSKYFPESAHESAYSFALQECFRNFHCIMAFLNCPGAITLRRSFHSEKLQRARRKRTGFGFCSHNIVDFPRDLPQSIGSDAHARLTGMIRRHLVRGHTRWRDTPREYWQPAFWRGNPARGIILKEYRV